MKIFVINLKRSTERRKHMEKQLKRLGLDYEFVEAVDGRALSDEALRGVSDLDNYMKHPTWESRGKGLIGCALSHRNVYEEIVKRQIPRALILEDDTFIKKEMGELLEKIDTMKNIGEKELILFEAESLGETVHLSSLHPRKLTEKYELLYPMDAGNVWLASAYSISYESAKKFLEVYQKVERVADVWGAFYEKGIFSTISCVTPFAVYQGAFDSSIGSYVAGQTLKSKIKHFIRQISPAFYLALVQLKSAKDNAAKERYVLEEACSTLDPAYVKDNEDREL